MSKLEMPDLPWFRVEEEIQRLRKTGMLEWICHLRPTYPPWEGIEGTPFTTTLRNNTEEDWILGCRGLSRD